MTLALPSGLFRLQCHLKSPLLPSSLPVIRAFISSLSLDTEETPAVKALKDIPYPSASPDPSIFESWSDEYVMTRLPRDMRAQKGVASLRGAKRHHPSLVLERLIRSKRFEEAEQVRQDLVEMNVPIRPSREYYSAAWNVLRQRRWPPNRTEMFTNWLSLHPTIASGVKPDHFGELKSYLLFNTPRLDLESIAQFGIVLSSKGYIRKVGASVIACLTHHADPDFSSRILDEMIAASDDYRRRNPGILLDAWVRRRTYKRLWSVAVRSHCTAGRPEVALQMTKRAHAYGFRLTGFSYEYLLGKLHADGLDDLAAELRAHPLCRNLDVAKSRLVVDASDLIPIPLISRKQPKAVNQAIPLAMLKRCSRSGLPAYAVDIVPYFDIYKTHVRGGQDVDMLRSHAYRISVTALLAVLLAEQLHHHRRGQFRHVLWVFEKFFHVVGVPSEDLTRQLWKREDYPSHLRIQPESIPARIKKTTFNLPSGLWPTPYHTALVWSALVHLCENEEELFALYDLLLQRSAQFQKTTVDHHHHHHYSHQDPFHGSSIPAAVPASQYRVDAAHFRPFLTAFTQLRNAEYGLRVLDDMQDRGIAPSTQILGLAAALQARYGEPVLALRMLDIMRELTERGDQEVDVEMEMRIRSQVGIRERDNKQEQLIAAHTSVLRGFIDRRNIVQARRVAELLRSHLGYVEERGGSDGGGVDGDGDGSSSRNARTDAVLRYLRRLEVEGPEAVPESLADEDVDAGYFYPFLKKRDPELIKALNAAPGTEPFDSPIPCPKYHNQRRQPSQMLEPLEP